MSDSIDFLAVEGKIVEALKTVFDPEIPVNVYDLGLIYDVIAKPAGEFHVEMTLTSPHCPVAETLPIEAREAAESVEGVTKASVEVVWEPSWTPNMMSEAAQLELGML